MPIDLLKKIFRDDSEEIGKIRIAPAEQLCNSIEGFYIYNPGKANAEELLFSDGFPVIAFLPMKRNKVIIKTPGETITAESGWIDCGIIKKSYLYFPGDTGSILIVRFNPSFFNNLFNLNPNIFRSKSIITLNTFIKRTYCYDLNKVFSFSNNHNRIKYLEYLFSKAPAGKSPNGLITESLGLIKQKKGVLSVNEITNALDTNYKSLERSFNNHLGLKPKEYIQLQRFINAFKDLTDNTFIKQNDTAIQNGYYDYNYFCKEFKLFTGFTPQAFLKSKQNNNIVE
jgi:AraC-like DNA-binding protein